MKEVYEFSCEICSPGSHSKIPCNHVFESIEAQSQEVEMLRQENKKLKADLVEAYAELIYSRLYAAEGGIWDAVETKEVWRAKARLMLR